MTSQANTNGSAVPGSNEPTTNPNNDRSACPASPLHSRRRFLSKATALTAGAAASIAFGLPTPPKAAARGRFSRGLYAIRRIAAKSLRVAAALKNYATSNPNNKSNGDEKTFDDYIGNFSKTLPHDDYGEVDSSAYRSLLIALRNRSSSAWENITLSPEADRRLVSPQASLAFSLAGGDSHSFYMPPAPAFNSAEEASEMAEVYLHALLRDIPFDEYVDTSSHPAVQFAADELNAFSTFTGPREEDLVTTRTLFRGSFDGDLVGNYVSQFLLLPVPQGAGTFEQRYDTPVPGDDHMLNHTDWLNVLRGGNPFTTNTFEATPKYITTARSLGEYVHRDYSYQTYLQAALILLGLGAPLQPNNPYNTSSTQEGFATFGDPDVLTQVGEVTLYALKAAWYHKWQVHRRLRPEVFGGRVHFAKTAGRAYPIHPELMNSPVLDAIALNFGGEYWLPMAYPEGSPTHPAYPAGHATMAGACVTILKAFFDGSAIILDPVEVVPGSGGTALQPYSGSDTLTVEGELNKLANNIAIGRNLAGVHWRTDGTEGILLGEQVAVRMLRDYKRTYNEKSNSLSFTGFRGNTITI